MRSLDNLSITSQQNQALNKLHNVLITQFEIEKIILFGSLVRGEADVESDIDLLILTLRPFTRIERHMITDTVFEINLQFDTNFSTLVVDFASWKSGAFSVLPIRDEISSEGIQL